MENNAELIRLEQFVDSLLTKYKQLKQSYTALEAALEQKQAECDTLNEKVEELRGERSVVVERVSGLIDRMEQWEGELETESEGDEDSAEDEELAGVQGNLFKGKTDAVKQ